MQEVVLPVKISLWTRVLDCSSLPFVVFSAQSASSAPLLCVSFSCHSTYFFSCVTAGSTVVAPCLSRLPTPFYISYKVPPPPSSTLSLPCLHPLTLLLTVSNSVGCQEQQSSKINITLFFFSGTMYPCPFYSNMILVLLMTRKRDRSKQGTLYVIINTPTPRCPLSDCFAVIQG